MAIARSDSVWWCQLLNFIVVSEIWGSRGGLVSGFGGIYLLHLQRSDETTKQDDTASQPRISQSAFIRKLMLLKFISWKPEVSRRVLETSGQDVKLPTQCRSHFLFKVRSPSSADHCPSRYRHPRHRSNTKSLVRSKTQEHSSYWGRILCITVTKDTKHAHLSWTPLDISNTIQLTHHKHCTLILHSDIREENTLRVLEEKLCWRRVIRC
jgi:hypothetical protein